MGILLALARIALLSILLSSFISLFLFLIHLAAFFFRDL
jgi:hypothetical protein